MLEKNKKHNERISTSEEMTRCVKCKNKILKTDKYCQYCGHATKTMQQVQPLAHRIIGLASLALHRNTILLYIQF